MAKQKVRKTELISDRPNGITTSDAMIYDIYTKHKIKDRDELVKKEISFWMKSNISAITDGIINHIPKISRASAELISRHYNIDKATWKEISNIHEVKKYIPQLGSILNIGLIISYLDTGNTIYLTYLFILHYSSIYPKYMTNGSHNPHIMKYTIQTADDRTDFKKEQMSLISVVSKKLIVFTRCYMPDITPGKQANKKYMTDRFIRLTLQASKTRINDMFKKLYRKYKANMSDPDIKVMLEITKTADGKHIMSMSSVFDKLREKASEGLLYVSLPLLANIGLTSKSTGDDRKHFQILYSYFYGKDMYQLMSKANSMVLDKWITTHSTDQSIDNFRKTFIRTLMNGRKISHIYAVLDSVVDDITMRILDDADNREKLGELDLTVFNKVVMRNYLYRYLVINLYKCSIEMFSK